MTSINESLTPDLLFNIFKRLDCVETTIVRRVCKQWFEIIDEHKIFWRTLHLPEKSLKKWDPSILELFDGKSESSLQDVDIGAEMREVQQAQIINTLKKSKAHLKHLSLLRTRTSTSLEDLLDSFSSMESLRLLTWYDSSKVCLRRRLNRSDSREDGSNTASPLKVLWYRDDLALLQISGDRFKNLVSLDTTADLSSSEWRKFLEGPSRSLKHLRIGFKNGHDEDHSGVPDLCFPNLEVLELEDGGEVPRWILIPDTVKLINNSGASNLPSVSGLWTWAPDHQRNDIINRLPKLSTLCLCYVHDLNRILEILIQRKANVEAGLHVDGVKMEMIKTLVLPFILSGPDVSDQLDQFLKKCSELVDVVEGNAYSRFIEVGY